MLALERAMLGSFGDADGRFSMVMEISSGAVAFILIVMIEISMIIKAKKKNAL